TIPNTRCGAVRAACTIPSASGESVISTTSHPTATCWTHIPPEKPRLASHSKRKSPERKELKIPERMPGVMQPNYTAAKGATIAPPRRAVQEAYMHLGLFLHCEQRAGASQDAAFGEAFSLADIAEKGGLDSI